MSVQIINRDASYNYFILDSFEAGLCLVGAEVKSIRMGKANIKDSFVRIVKGEAFIFQMHISYSSTVNPYFRPDEKRVRKLLLHRRQIDKLHGQVSQKGLSIIPIKVYFNNKGIAKVLIALAKGKKNYDKREAIKKRDMNREAGYVLKGVAKL